MDFSNMSAEELQKQILAAQKALAIQQGIDASGVDLKSDALKIFKNNNDYHLYSPKETVRRARSRLGESSYNLATNNCEHFAIWCKTGISESHQVNMLIG